MNLRVVKLGGSLLDLPDVAQRLRAWLAGQPAAATVLVAGGGQLAKAIRRAQGLHQFDDQAAHQLCMEVMGVTARLAAEIVLEARYCADVSDINRRAVDTIQICDTRRLVLAANKSGELPESWDLTSDSIAAHLALVLRAEELVLLKSTLPDSIGGVESLAAAELVDRCFPEAMHRYCCQARQVGRDQPCIRLVNLRDDRFAEVSLAEAAAPN